MNEEKGEEAQAKRSYLLESSKKKSKRNLRKNMAKQKQEGVGPTGAIPPPVIPPTLAPSAPPVSDSDGSASGTFDTCQVVLICEGARPGYANSPGYANAPDPYANNPDYANGPGASGNTLCC